MTDTQIIPRPATPPAYGQETARWVLDVITANPELHDQDIWGDIGPNACGTTHCVGGWTLMAHANNIPQYTNLSKSRQAAKLLDISGEDAVSLFYCTTEEQAVKALGYIARGEPINWLSVGINSLPNVEET